LLVGVGGNTPMPIPKFDETGKPLGFVAEDEVPQRSTFGLSDMAPEDIEGYHARNAPFGSAPLGGTEHLSALREDYLRELAGASGLGYRRLEADTLAEALLQPEYAKPARVFVDLRWIPATLALALTVFAYLQGRIHAADAATRARPAGFWRAALPWRRGRLSAADP
jgi:mxaL protein